MAAAEEKQAFTSTYAPIREEEREGNDQEFDDIASSSGYCCCFGIGGWRKTNHESKYLLQETNNGHEQYKESWYVNKLKKLKEYSEVVAGPKWKNFVRKIGKYLKPKKSRTQSMYSPQSYALNFDDAEEQEDDLFASFSSRFSAPLSGNQQKTAGSS